MFIKLSNNFQFKLLSYVIVKYDVMLFSNTIHVYGLAYFVTWEIIMMSL